MNIALFDSGLGGLTALKEIIDKDNNYIYLGDNKNIPYGNKDKETIFKLTCNIMDYLTQFDVDVFIAACNTICSNDLDKIRSKYNKNIISIIDQAIICAKKTYGDILVLATERTVKSHIYKSLLKDRKVYEVSCPKFVDIIESDFDRKKLDYYAAKYLKIANEKKIKNIILGCTHYPLIEDIILKNLNYDCNLINPATRLKEIIGEGKSYQTKIFLTGKADCKNHIKSIINRDFVLSKAIIE